MTPNELFAIRTALGLTQAQLGREIGRHRNTIADWEHGKRPVPAPVAQLLPYLLNKEAKP